MNKNTNKWAVIIGSPNIGEAVQRIAFSFGYRWNFNSSIVHITAYGSALIFDPSSNQMLYNLNLDGNTVCKVCTTMEEVLDTFKNPPKAVKSVVFGNSEIYDDGSVLIAGTSMTVKEFDNLIDTRNAFIKRAVDNKIPLLPVVKFIYDSPTSGRHSREGMVVKDGFDAWHVLDMKDGNAYKVFLKNRIAGPVEFIGFANNPVK